MFKFNKGVALEILELIREEPDSFAPTTFSASLPQGEEGRITHNFLGIVASSMDLQCTDCNCNALYESLHTAYIPQGFVKEDLIKDMLLAITKDRKTESDEGFSANFQALVANAFEGFFVPRVAPPMLLLGLTVGKLSLLTREGISLDEIEALINWFGEADYHGNDGFDMNGISTHGKHRSLYSDADPLLILFEGRMVDPASFNTKEWLSTLAKGIQEPDIFFNLQERECVTLLGKMKHMYQEMRQRLAFEQGLGQLVHMLADKMGADVLNVDGDMGEIMNNPLMQKLIPSIMKGVGDVGNRPSIKVEPIVGDDSDAAISLSDLKPTQYGVLLKQDIDKETRVPTITGLNIILRGKVAYAVGAPVIKELIAEWKATEKPIPTEPLIETSLIANILENPLTMVGRILEHLGTEGIILTDLIEEALANPYSMMGKPKQKTSFSIEDLLNDIESGEVDEEVNVTGFPSLQVEEYPVPTIEETPEESKEVTTV